MIYITNNIRTSTSSHLINFSRSNRLRANESAKNKLLSQRNLRQQFNINATTLPSFSSFSFHSSIRFLFVNIFSAIFLSSPPPFSLFTSTSCFSFAKLIADCVLLVPSVVPSSTRTLNSKQNENGTLVVSREERTKRCSPGIQF